MPTVEEVTIKYIELRDRKAQIAKRQQEELAPLNEAMQHIENWLLAQMNQLGVDSFKTSAGTPYRAISQSVQMQDALAYKDFVFAPAIDNIINMLTSSGYELDDVARSMIPRIIRDSTRWDMVDFRAGKKGILEYFEQAEQLPPGIAINSMATVNVRRS